VGSFVVKRACAYCRGHGRIGTPVAFKPNSNLCPVCRGEGTNEFEENIRICSSCGGNGLEQGGAGKQTGKCAVCGGTGWTPYGNTVVHR